MSYKQDKLPLQYRLILACPLNIQKGGGGIDGVGKRGKGEFINEIVRKRLGKKIQKKNVYKTDKPRTLKSYRLGKKIAETENQLTL